MRNTILGITYISSFSVLSKKDQNILIAHISFDTENNSKKEHQKLLS
jgi:hypothetical protein